MSRKIYGVTVGTPLKPQKIIDKTLEQAKDYVDSEIATFDFIKVVDALPEIGLPNRFYLVPKPDPQTQDLFDEYLWTEQSGWEWVATKQIEVDLTEYAKKTDYVTENKAGIIKQANPGNGVGHNEVGGLYIVNAPPGIIDLKSSQHRPITPSVLDYAVKVGITTNTNELTAEEKATACGWLGVKDCINEALGVIENGSY
jgi:hypothetical protein